MDDKFPENFKPTAKFEKRKKDKNRLNRSRSPTDCYRQGVYWLKRVGRISQDEAEDLAQWFFVYDLQPNKFSAQRILRLRGKFSDTSKPVPNSDSVATVPMPVVKLDDREVPYCETIESKTTANADPVLKVIEDLELTDIQEGILKELVMLGWGGSRDGSFQLPFKKVAEAIGRQSAQVYGSIIDIRNKLRKRGVTQEELLRKISDEA